MTWLPSVCNRPLPGLRPAKTDSAGVRCFRIPTNSNTPRRCSRAYLWVREFHFRANFGPVLVKTFFHRTLVVRLLGCCQGRRRTLSGVTVVAARGRATACFLMRSTARLLFGGIDCFRRPKRASQSKNLGRPTIGLPQLGEPSVFRLKPSAFRRSLNTDVRDGLRISVEVAAGLKAAAQTAVAAPSSSSRRSQAPVSFDAHLQAPRAAPSLLRLRLLAGQTFGHSPYAR